MVALLVSRIRSAAPLSRDGDDSASFATYMRHRPEPVDGVERSLLRLDWLRGRLAHRRSA